LVGATAVVSDTNDYAAGHVCGTLDAVGVPESVTCDANGQYVTIETTGASNALTVCELHVFAVLQYQCAEASMTFDDTKADHVCASRTCSDEQCCTPKEATGADVELQWAVKVYEDIEIAVGDTVIFTYDSSHNVYLHPTGTCDTQGSTEIGARGASLPPARPPALHSFLASIQHNSLTLP
jgi:plastocyanin